MARRTPKKRGVVYLVHLDRPLKHARHYMGFAEGRDWRERIERHRAGAGSKLLRAVGLAGIGFRVVRVWRNVDRKFERSLKNRKQAPALCPMCSGPGAHGRGRR